MSKGKDFLDRFNEIKDDSDYLFVVDTGGGVRFESNTPNNDLLTLAANVAECILEGWIPIHAAEEVLQKARIVESLLSSIESHDETRH